MAGRGANHWVERIKHKSIEAACSAVKAEGCRVLETHLAHDAIDYRDVDYTKPVALLFGNDQMGLSDAAIACADGNIRIPLVGVVEALNVSVAAAVILFEAKRQREAAGMYDQPVPDDAIYRKRVFEACYPVVAAQLQKEGRPYPELDDEGLMIT